MAFLILPKLDDYNYKHSHSSSLSADTKSHNYNLYPWLSDAIADDRCVGVSNKPIQGADCWMSAADLGLLTSLSELQPSKCTRGRNSIVGVEP